MKEILCIALCLVMLLPLAACGSSEKPGAATESPKPQEPQLLVGFGMVDITPTYSVPLGGYGNAEKRMSTGLQSYIYTSCIAYTYGETTILSFSNDLIRSDNTDVSLVRAAIESEYGIPQDHIMISATHQHTSPDTSNTKAATAAQYRNDLVKWMTKAAGLALEDRKPATGMYYGSANPESLNFIRHYTTEAGIIKGDSTNTHIDSPYTGHTHKADNLLQVVKITRDGGKDLVLVNWQSHPHRGGSASNTNIHSDIVGVMRDYVTENRDAVFAYFTAASGNVNPSSRIKTENITQNYKEQGQALGQYAVDILNGEMTPVEMGPIKTISQEKRIDINHTEDHLVMYAKEVQAVWKETNDHAAATAVGVPYGIQSPYHANAIITRMNMPATGTLPLSAFCVGELGFAVAPYEMFDTNGQEIREGSPFAHTFVLTCSNGAYSYIPSMEGVNNQTYEANLCRYVPGTGEMLAQEYVKMLEQLKAQ